MSSDPRYGDVCRIPTTGASMVTAQQDKLTFVGVTASEYLAHADLETINTLKTKIDSVANKKEMDAAVIAAVISRETRGGRTLENGWGNNGTAWGVMQVDKRWNTPRGECDSEEHIAQATNLIIEKFNSMKRKFPTWSKDQILKGALAAYNMGDQSVKSFEEVDRLTTGQDYANDVVARAQYFKRNGY
ncbi:lysozyme G-like [Pelobates fuscus]|uniref:lysozyme G-like n=1 Tax=Pelobates fuscus TaxID=191477 RepID=UPI002FE42DB5